MVTEPRVHEDGGRALNSERLALLTEVRVGGHPVLDAQRERPLVGGAHGAYTQVGFIGPIADSGEKFTGIKPLIDPEVVCSEQCFDELDEETRLQDAKFAPQRIETMPK